MLLALADTGLVASGASRATGPPRVPVLVTSTIPGPAAAPASARAPASPQPAMARSIPVTVDIPAIGVRARVVPVGLRPDGTVEVPPLGRDAPVGWYRHLATPGEPGPAVLLGHVDSAAEGPAVFWALARLRAGDRVAVHRANGTTATFAVRTVASYPKRGFPSAAVYGPTSAAELRLITCGGTFDRGRGTYRDNVIAFAALVTSGRP